MTDITVPDEVDEALGSPWEDLRAYIALPRLASLDLAPDGSWLLAGVQQLDADQTAWKTALWRIDLEGGAPRRLTRGVEGESANAFLRDGSVVFSAKRPLPPAGEAPKESEQALWCLPAVGGEAYVLARRDGGWDQVWAAREADRLVCAVGLRGGIDDPEQDAKLRAERTKKKVRAILHEGYPVRYWDHDLDSQTTRFVRVDLPAEGEPSVSSDDIRYLHDDLGRGLTSHGVLSDDGTFLVVGENVAEPHGSSREALVRIDVESGERTVLLGAAGQEFGSPVLSTDGGWLACVRSENSTTEQAPREFLHLLDLGTGQGRDLAVDWDRWPHPVAWSPNADVLYCVADEDGESPIFAVDVASGQVRRLTGHGAFSSVRLSRDGGTLFAIRSAYDDQGSVVRIDVASGELTELRVPGEPTPLPGTLERVETTAADGTRVAGWLCLPAGTSAQNPSRLALWIHGGPLGSWNAWSWRWCPWLLVSQGWAVLLPDPALSTGYGQQMVQRGWGRWGAEPYTDLMTMTDSIESRDDIDASRTVAMGGSFGGYMANWVAGHTDRFAAIVTHASLWNLTSFGPTTDASWYWARELSPQMAAENSPHQFAHQITTPMLVIHGDRDYRVPIGEGLGLWWELNSHWSGDPADMPHKFLYFPDENHWVLTPQHAMIWYETVRAFLEAHAEGVAFIRSSLL